MFNYMPQNRFKWKWLVLLILPLFPTYSQTRYSLQEAIQYGTTHNINVKNTQTDAQSAESRIGEIRAVGLPQVSASVSLLDNLIIQRAFLPAVFFDQNAPSDAPPIAVQFGVKYSGNAALQLNQILFNAQWLLGLKAAQAYRELAVKNITQSKIQVAESVSKAYYSVLVAEERAKLLDLNIQRLDSLTREMGAMNQKGFVEKLDVDRLEVSLNNLKTERAKVQNLVDLSYYMLKFQMGMKLDEQILLTDRINEADVDRIAAEVKADDGSNFSYDQRIDYSILKNNLQLSEMDVENNKRGYYPTVSLLLLVTATIQVVIALGMYLARLGSTTPISVSVSTFPFLMALQRNTKSNRPNLRWIK
jgi:outer membrane protein TolC